MWSTRRLRLVGAALAFFTLVAGPTGAQTSVSLSLKTTVWGRPDAPALQARTDFEDCTAQAQKIDIDSPRAVYIIYDVPVHGGHGSAHAGVHGGGHVGGGHGGGGHVATHSQGGRGSGRGGGVAAGAVVGSAVGSAVGTAVAESMWVEKLRATFFPRCMHAKGYGGVVLTGMEGATFNGTRESHQMAWIDALYAKPDFAARLAAALRPVEPLPDAGDLTRPSLSVRYDLTALTAATGVVTGPRGAVLSGNAAHRVGVAHLTEAIAKNGSTPDFPVGQEFDAVVYPGPDGDKLAYWCAKLPHGGFGLTPWRCFRQVGDYYTMVKAPGSSDAPSFTDDPSLAETPDFNDVDIKLDTSETNPAPPLAMVIRVRKITDHSVELVESVGDVDNVWSAELPFDPDGHAVLPFWDHRLLLTRADKDGVTVVWQADGDGTPPPECADADGMSC